MTRLEAAHKLRFVPLFVIKDLSVLELPKVEIVIEILCRECVSPAVHQRLHEEGDDAQEAIFLLEKLDVGLGQVPMVPLYGALLDLAFLDEGAYYAELWVILLLGLKVVAHFDLQEAAQRVD